MLKRLVLRQPSATGLFVGAVFLGLSLTPSLLPRTWLLQGVASGLALITGYGVGALLAATWSYLELPELDGQARVRAQWIAGSVAAGLLVFFLAKTGNWQNRVRELVGLPPASSTNPLSIVVVAIVVACLVLITARLVRGVTRRTARFVGRYVPVRVARVLGVVVIAALAYGLVSGVLLSGSVSLANSVFSVRDGTTDDGVSQPSSALRSGSAESASSWDDLGRQGRKFVGTGPTVADLDAVSNGAIEPIRVYVGQRSADSVEGRAQLALDELLRTGAFERDVLVVATSTGTGWLDPVAVDSLEYIHAGNTAIVSLQYSYLPSWISLLVDTEAARASAQALFDAVHDHWQTLDEDQRPELYLYGLSLGAYGSESSASRVSLLNDPVNGALWVGPPFVSDYWNAVTDNRDPGSPAWRPEVGDGRVIRFTNAVGDLERSATQWQDNRFIYLQYPTDPVVFFRPDSLVSQPEWLQGERGPGVTPDFHWYPLVTFWQLLVDLPNAGSVPRGYAHQYSAASYVDSWVALTQPSGWTDAKTELVTQRLAED